MYTNHRKTSSGVPGPKKLEQDDCLWQMLCTTHMAFCIRLAASKRRIRATWIILDYQTNLRR